MNIKKIIKAYWWLIGLVIIGAFLSLYKIPQTLMFAGDQGRDALRVARIWQQGDLSLIGPVTSIGNMYLGPFYYYYMLPWLALSYPSPVGPAYGVAILSILTIVLMYFLGHELVGKKAAFFATALFTFSSVTVAAARFSWNPNPAPLFSLLLIWALYKAMSNHHRYWLLVAFSFSILIQLHYMTLLCIFPIMIVWTLCFRKRVETHQFIKQTALAFIIGLIFILPLFVFDMKHQGVNAAALKDLLGGKNSITRVETKDNSLGSKVLSVLGETHGRSMLVLFDMHFGVDRARNTLLVILTFAVVVWLYKNRQPNKGVRLVGLFVLTGIIGTSFYAHSLYDHYVLFLLPAVFLTFGWIFDEWWSSNLLGKLATGVFMMWFVSVNVPKYPFSDFSPNLDQLNRETQEIAQKIKANESYNVVLLSESKDYYGQNYRYYLSTIPNKRPVDPSFDNITDVDTLVIVDELKLTPEAIDLLGIYELDIFKNTQDRQEFITSDGTPILIWRKSKAYN